MPRADLQIVGRDVELGQLMSAFDEAKLAGAARVVTLLGDPGVGKTRLLEELVNRTSADARILRDNRLLAVVFLHLHPHR